MLQYVFLSLIRITETNAIFMLLIFFYTGRLIGHALSFDTFELIYFIGPSGK